MSLPVATALDVLDWRRRTAALYAEVRDTPDPAQAHAAWATGRSALMLRHPATPVLPEHRGPDDGGRVDGAAEVEVEVEVGPYDPALRFEARVEDAEPERSEVPTGTDGTVVLERIGRVRLGDLGTLDVWWHAGYGGGVFVPERDLGPGPGEPHYGGGRYVLDTIKGADLGTTSAGRLVVDLNFAFHPSCAYDPAWACPLAPPGNRLDAEVAGGERYVGLWAHLSD